MKKNLLIFSLFLIPFIFPPNKAHATTVDYLGQNQSAASQGYVVNPNPTACGTPPTPYCATSSSISESPCSVYPACPNPGGNITTWAKYSLDTTCYEDEITQLPAWLYDYNAATCSIADKYNGNPDFPGGNLTEARYGSCDCSTGNIYKTCCNGTTPTNTYNYTTALGQGNPLHPDAGCAGTSFPQCGSPGFPDCGVVACAGPATPPPTPPPPPPTPPPVTGCTNAPTTTPSTFTTVPAQPSCSPIGQTCPVPCTKTCTDSIGQTCPISGVLNWFCGGTQWTTDGTCSATCPTFCVTPTSTPAPTLPPPGSCTYADIRCPSSCQGGGTYYTAGTCLDGDEDERGRFHCFSRVNQTGCYDTNLQYCGQASITNRYCASSNYWGSACQFTWSVPNRAPLCGNDQWGCYCPSWALGYPITVDCTSTNNSNYGNYCHNTTPGDDSTCGAWSGPSCGTQTRICKTTNCSDCSATRQVCSLTISGNVFVDANQNGVKDNGEANYSGGVLSDGYSSTTSDASGNYAFANLQAGNYVVTFTLPAKYDSTTTNPLVVSLTTDNQTAANFGIARNDNWSISGNVFIDTNNNQIKDAGEANYTGAVTINVSPTGTATYPGAGQFLIDGLKKGSYTVSYANPPTGYTITYPPNGPPPSFAIGLGPCSPGSSNSASCQGKKLINLNFGINYLKPWFQCVGGDCRVDSGFTTEVPVTAIGGAYANLNGTGGTPGLVFTGNSTPNFGQGQSSTTGWVVGGADPTLSETYAPNRMGGQVKTSYDFLLAKAVQGNITQTDLSTICSLSNCTLPGNLSPGIYKANSSVTLVGGGATAFTAGKNYVILINGDLKISTKINVPQTATAVFSTTGNITVDKTLGEIASDNATMTIQGIYSAGKSFIADGNSSCSVGPDPRLNIAGSVITNGQRGGGSFQNLRDLCGNDVSYPSVSFFERADFALSSPEFLKQPNFTYQEVAP